MVSVLAPAAVMPDGITDRILVATGSVSARTLSCAPVA